MKSNRADAKRHQPPQPTWLRMPPEALAAGHSPLITLTSYEEKRLAKLTDSPATPISKLRTIAADNDFFVNF